MYGTVLLHSSVPAYISNTDIFKNLSLTDKARKRPLDYSLAFYDPNYPLHSLSIVFELIFSLELYTTGRFKLLSCNLSGMFFAHSAFETRLMPSQASIMELCPRSIS